MKKILKNNFFKNASYAFIFQAINLIITFVVRTIFIKKLGNDYLSIDGLFANIISLLSFAELGIGTAIIYCLYKPIAEKDNESIKSYMILFKKTYKWIRTIIICLGLIIIPFLRYIINDITIKENIIFIYILLLLNTYFSYFMAYKKSLLIADQKNYIVVFIQEVVIVIQSVIQVLILCLSGNYILFLILKILGTVMINILSSKYVDKKYLYINESASELSEKKKKTIFKNIKNIFYYKVGAIILNSTDNILISSLISTALVGLYSNYLLIVNAVNSVLMQACNSISASIGIHNVKNDNKKNEKMFIKIFIISYVLFGICTICLIELLNPFINLWIGKDYLLSSTTVIIIALVFYVTGINQIVSQYRTSFGIFQQARFVPIIAAILNVFFSIVLGRLIGLDGIFIATIIAKIFTFNIIDPILVYKIGFKNKSKSFFILKFKLFIYLCVIYLIVHYLNNQIFGCNYIIFAIKSLVVFLVTSVLLGGIIIFKRKKKYE